MKKIGELMNWWLLAALVVFLFLIMKIKEIRHKLGLLFLCGGLLFLVSTFGQIYMQNNFDLTTFEGFVQAGKAYVHWLGSAGDNVIKTVGYVINQDWGARVVGNATGLG